MATRSRTPRRNDSVPPRYRQLQKRYPHLLLQFEELGNAAQQAGPLSGKTRELVKLALAIGARLEGAVHSHTRRALAEGCTADEIRHVAVLATTTLGFPSMVIAHSWIEDVLSPGRK